jgi:hypothetical protein
MLGRKSMKKSPSSKTIWEPAREVKVCKEADVVVVGDGPAGVAAAVTAARNGANTVLVERYGHLGGLATGGLVIVIMPMSDGTKEQQIAGLCQEIVDRLDARGGAIHPRKEDLGSSDSRLVSYWRRYPFSVIEGKLTLGVSFDPEALKCILNDMIEEAGVKLFLHSWSTQAIVNNNKVQGVIFESKSGRQAILGKVIVDTTGDGDIFASAGAEFDSTVDPKNSRANLALVFRIGNIDMKEYTEFRESEPPRYIELMRELSSLGGLTMYIRTSREDVIWVNNQIPERHGLKVEDLTWVEINVRKRMLITHDFLKKRIPGFEQSFIMDTASQIGVRCTRRLIGEYVLTEKDVFSGVIHPDTIAVCPDFRHNVSVEHPHWHIPYRSLVPRKIDNLLAAGRCFSSDPVANEVCDPIQFCIAMGQAAGTAAALATKYNIAVRDVNHKELQSCLVKQGVPLLGVMGTPIRMSV